jgi:UDP-4-amino-4,6-dideoxy-N-acetyl-beta-L-altrosamine transaminase
MAFSYLPYGHQWIGPEDIAAVTNVLEADFLTQGPQVAEFEQAICGVTGARHCVAFCNATAALTAAVASFGDKGDGITSPNTFLASANCLIYNGLRPRFADIDPRTYNMDPAKLEKAIGPDTKVVIPVHFAGQPADMEAIRSVTAPHRVAVIEDAAHAIGSRYEDGSAVGCCRHSEITVFSFHPVKTITTGEGGAATTNDEDLYARMKAFRSHGIERDPKLMEKNPGPWYHEMRSIGFNLRLTDFQAALGRSQLARLAAFKARRREIVRAYNAAFQGRTGVRIPFERAGVDSCFHLYVPRFDFSGLKTTRKDVMAKLSEKGIGTQVHYIPVHTQPYYRKTWGYSWGDFPEAEAYYEQALSLPLFPRMDDEDVRRVIDCVGEALG